MATIIVFSHKIGLMPRRPKERKEKEKRATRAKNGNDRRGDRTLWRKCGLCRSISEVISVSTHELTTVGGIATLHFARKKAHQLISSPDQQFFSFSIKQLFPSFHFINLWMRKFLRVLRKRHFFLIVI